MVKAILLVEKSNFTNVIKTIFSKALNNSFKKKVIFVNSIKDLNKIKKFNQIDYLFNFQQRLISEEILKCIKHPINFHPGSTKYPGRGGYCWAIYNKSNYYGCVAHIMEKKVDSGKILEEILFPIEKFDNIESLKFKCLMTNLKIFYGILIKLNFNKKLTYKNIKWKRKPYKLADLSKINTFNKSSSDKLKKLVTKATEYYPFGPYLSDGKKITKVKIKRKNHIF